MLFNSYVFCFIFFPITIIGYYLLNKWNYKIGLAFLGIMSLVFYGYNMPQYIILIIVSLVVNYSLSVFIMRTNKSIWGKAALFFDVLFNVGLLFYFKYCDFFIINIGKVLHRDFVTKGILLPLGISFFTFQQISYVVDTFNEETEGYSFLEYFVFVTFFPQLVAGPIVLHDEMIPQFRDSSKKEVIFDNFADGIVMFSLGLFKKLILADTFGRAVSWGFAYYYKATSSDLFLTMIAYSFQIYFDFSGYCDMAGGIAKMLNIDLPINFNSPYKSMSISDFWKRWHMTLTRFLTKYIYIPLGGNRKSEFRTYLNVLIVFLISGLWHGANWTFILWGGLHGVFMVIYRFSKNHFHISLHPAVSWGGNFFIINVLWLLFRSEKISLWIVML